jgi:hypothetical protein
VKIVVLIIMASLAISITVALAIVWALRTFGMDIDYSWQSVAAVWITMAVINGIMMRAKEQ